MSPSASPGNVFFADEIDRGPWILYDRLTSAANGNTANQYPFFSVPIGGSKTKSDTNMLRTVLGPPRAFSTQSIGFIFGSTMFLSDVYNFIKNYYFEFKIGGDKVFAEGCLDLFPGGAGIWTNVASTHGTAALFSSVANGDPSLLSCRRFPDYPRVIPSNIPFQLNVNVGAGVVALFAAVAVTIVSPAYGGLDLRAVLDGIMDREVQ